MKLFKKQHNFFSGLRLRQILNDLKRRPEDAARELKISNAEFNRLLNGKSILTDKLVKQITSIWPIKLVDLINPFYDIESNYKIMKASSSKKTSRIMQRGGVDYYEYQDDGSCKNVKGLGNGSCSDPARFSAQKYKGENGRLAKCKYARKCGVEWDGITNVGLC